MSRERMSVALNRFGVDEFPKLHDYAWHGRLMFGTDLPVWQAHENCGLTERYREYVRAFRATGLEAESDGAFRRFVAGVMHNHGYTRTRGANDCANLRIAERKRGVSVASED